jgi:DNA modification methylase
MNFYRKSDIPDDLQQYFEPAEIGLEETPEAYVARLVEVFREVRRVLRDDGTLWLNLGDTYWGGKGTNGTSRAMRTAADRGWTQSPGTPVQTIRPQDRRHPVIKPKDLIGIPWRVAFALQADGWYLRQDIIWHKPNPMPESVKDRCTKAHEYIFLLSKSPKYYFDNEAIMEPAIYGEQHAAKATSWGTNRKHPNKANVADYAFKGDNATCYKKDDGRFMKNKRSVWTVTTKPYKGSHFATFPPALIAPMILAGCPVGGKVLDPFGGSGTTGEVSESLGRNSILIELNPDYIELQKKRTAQMGLGLCLSED